MRSFCKPLIPLNGAKVRIFCESCKFLFTFLLFCGENRVFATCSPLKGCPFVLLGHSFGVFVSLVSDIKFLLKEKIRF